MQWHPLIYEPTYMRKSTYEKPNRFMWCTEGVTKVQLPLNAPETLSVEHRADLPFVTVRSVTTQAFMLQHNSYKSSGDLSEQSN
jgi:hypothetical protein